jgi:hypothetical protein
MIAVVLAYAWMAGAAATAGYLVYAGYTDRIEAVRSTHPELETWALLLASAVVGTVVCVLWPLALYWWFSGPDVEDL